MLRRSANIAIALLVATSGVALAQDDPFGSGGAFSPADTGSPFGAASPFDAPGAGGATASPFDAPGAGTPTAPPAAAGAASADPFGGGGGGFAPAGDPFGGGATTDPFAAAAGVGGAPAGDPFGGGGAFGAAPAPGGAAADPFAAGGFGAPAAGAGDPFGAPAAAAADPFGAPAAPAPGGQPQPLNPFGGIFGAASGTPETVAENEGAGITTLYTFRYTEVPRINGTTVVVRARMTWDEGEAFDEARKKELETEITNGDYTAYQPGVTSVTHWAQWLHYAEQVERWRRYCVATLLIDVPVQEDEYRIVWPGERFHQAPEAQQQAGGQGGGMDEFGGGGGRQGGGGRAAARPSQQGTGRNIHTEGDRSIDDQMGDFFTTTTVATNDGREVHDPSVMNDQAVTLYREFTGRLRQQEEEQGQFIRELTRTMRQRELTREAYAGWRQSQMESIVEYVAEWERQYSGRVTTIAGVRYELFNPDSVPPVTTRGANVVITDHDLTPYDILNEDGTLRGPAR